MRGKTALFFLFIFSILSLQCTPKIYDTPEANVTYSTITVSFTVSGAMSVGSKVLFTPVISGGAGANYKLEWDWNNDGTIDYACMYPAVNKVEHEFWEAKTYSVRLKVTDKSGSAFFIMDVPIIEGLKPLEITSIYQMASPLMSGVEITFTGTVQFGSGGYRVKWAFGDGSIFPPDGTYYVPTPPAPITLPDGTVVTPPGSGIEAVHTYASGGTYNVTLTVMDSAGNVVSKTVPFDIESHTKYLIIYQRNQEIWKMYQNGADKQKIEDGIAPSCRANGSFIAFCKTVGSGILIRYRLAKTTKTGAGTTVLLTDNPTDAADNQIKYYTEEDTKVSPDNGRILFRRKVKTVTIPAEITPGNYTLIRAYCNANPLDPDYAERQALLAWINNVYNVTTSPLPPYGVTQCKLKTGLTIAQKENTAAKFYQYRDVLLDGVNSFQTAAPVTVALSPEKDIYSVSASGGMPALFITNGEQPDFSPDGSTVAFTRDNNIYTVPSGGGGGETLRMNHAGYADFHPSGFMLAVSHAGGSGSDPSKLYLLYMWDTMNLILLSLGGNYGDVYIKWFPNGDRLIYSANTGTTETVNVTGIEEQVPQRIIYLASYPAGGYMFSINNEPAGYQYVGGILNNF